MCKSDFYQRRPIQYGNPWEKMGLRGKTVERKIFEFEEGKGEFQENYHELIKLSGVS